MPASCNILDDVGCFSKCLVVLLLGKLQKVLQKIMHMFFFKY